MQAKSEAVRLNLEFYRKQAKLLLKAAKMGDAAALERLAPHAFRQVGDANLPPSHPLRPTATLHDAQLTIAREQGFPSWPRFKTFIAQSSLDDQSLAAAFLELALSDAKLADGMLEGHAQIPLTGLYPPLVLGDVERVGRALSQTPALATAKGGPRNWEPLLYVCFSRYGSGASGRADDIVKTAQTLLAKGADPNASYTPDRWPGNPLSCLYAAAGLNNNSALALALLEAGANPNDSEALYHATEHSDLTCLRILLDHGASVVGTNALKHMLDREDMQGLKLLLAAGADPNETNPLGETALHWAVWRGRSAGTINVLLDSGAELNAQRKDGRTAYAMAVQSGQAETAALLESRGARGELSEVDRFVEAWVRSDTQAPGGLPLEAPAIVRSPENERLVPDLASSHRTAAVRALLAAGLPVDARGELGGTALHWACWKGYADLVKILLAHGASLTAEDEQFHGTPPGWFGHGLQNCHDEDGDYPEVARLLIAAGAVIPACDIPTGVAEVDAVLREHGVI